MIHAVPRPRTPDPKTAPALRWGILGPGWIAQRFTAAVQQHSEQKIVAVASRSATRAARFAQQWDIPTAHTGYDALLSDPNVDIVYISTPHVEHHGCALAALAAGKHVLVEKPMGFNATQAREVFTVEYITADYVAWYNQQRLMHRLGRIPPAEAEAQYYSQHVTDRPAGSQNPEGA